jgi:aspartate aminotransferase/aminotransferase
MEALAGFARTHGLYLISDEVYEDFVFEGEHVSVVFEGEHVSAAGLGVDDRVFLVSGVSKSYAMTGWRLGYLVCPPELAAVATSLQEPLISCAPAVSQKAAEAALAGPQDCVAEACETYRRRRDIVLDVLGNTGLLPVSPAGAFYALVDIGAGATDSVAFAKSLLLEHNVATVPGITFGPVCERMVRIAFTTDDEDLRKGLEHLRAFIQA